LARALAPEPKLVLMDEPFAWIDWQTRQDLHDELLTAWHRTANTILFVTHDLDEAVYLADRVMVLTERPATVRCILPIQISRPRSRRVRATSDFVALREQLVEVMEPDQSSTAEPAREATR